MKPNLHQPLTVCNYPLQRQHAPFTVHPVVGSALPHVAAAFRICAVSLARVRVHHSLFALACLAFALPALAFALPVRPLASLAFLPLVRGCYLLLACLLGKGCNRISAFFTALEPSPLGRIGVPTKTRTKIL